MTRMTTRYVYTEGSVDRDRKAMLIYPLIVLPFLAVLFWLFGGGKGERQLAQEAAAGKPGATGFNANVPTARGGSINGREVDNPGYGRAQAGQVLSSFTHTRREGNRDTIQGVTQGAVGPMPASSLATMPVAAAPIKSAHNPTHPRTTRPNAAALAVTGNRRATRGYYYQPPGSTTGYYTATASDQQLDRQLQQYERSQATPDRASVSSQTSQPSLSVVTTPEPSTETRPVTVRLTDHLTASRLSETVEAASPFVTANTGGTRPAPTRAVVSGGGFNKREIVWMIPVVVHEDQVIKDGQAVKLRLVKEISAEGVTIPPNTICYATCHLDDDRLRLRVRNLQLGEQLIPLDLDVYDTDGMPGINVPGLAQQSQLGGQLRSSVVQGVNVPGLGGVGNTVLNSARMGASQSLRQTTIRLRAGYTLFLKA